MELEKKTIVKLRYIYQYPDPATHMEIVSIIYWKAQSHSLLNLSIKCKIFLTIPASSAAVERLSVFRAKYLGQKIFCLENDRFEQLIFIISNNKNE